MSLVVFNKTKLLSSAYKQFCFATVKCSNKQVETKTEGIPQSPKLADLMRNTHVPSKIERWFLVWTGSYKSDKDIPPEISAATYERMRNKARIKIANYTMLATIFGAIIMVISGKRAAARGETLAKINRDWHAEMNKLPPKT